MNKNKCGVHFCPNCGFYSSVNFILKEHLEKCGVTDADYEALNKAKFNIGDIVFEKKYGSFYEILSTYIKYNEHTGKNQFVYVYETVFDYNVYETVSHWMPEKGLELYMSKRDLQKRLNEFKEKYPNAHNYSYNVKTNELVAEVRESL